MSTTNLFITTFNCGKKTPTSAEFTKHLSEKLPHNEGDDLDVPDLFVFGFQELASILDGTDFNKINQKLIWISDNLITCLSNKYGMQSFEIVSISHFGSVGVIVISPFISKISKVTKSLGYPVGHFYTNLKGGIGIRVVYNSTEFTFVCMHLNAGEKVQHLIKRNADLNNIMSRLSFSDGWSVLKPKTHCFIFGDLNYRATGAFGFTDDTREANSSVNANIDVDDDIIRNSLQKDELMLLKNKKLIIPDFEEAKIKFKPTYKFDIGTRNYNKKRIPSYCDRILYLGYSESTNLRQYKVVGYNSIPDCLISDHIPVYLSINIPHVPPESVINDYGYLIDRSTQLSESSKNFKDIEYGKYILKVSSLTTYIMRLALYLSITIKGRIIGLCIIIVIYLLLKLFGNI